MGGFLGVPLWAIDFVLVVMKMYLINVMVLFGFRFGKNGFGLGAYSAIAGDFPYDFLKILLLTSAMLRATWLLPLWFPY